MYTTNEVNAIKDIEVLLNRAITERQTIRINTQKGNVLLLNERGLQCIN